MVRKFLVDLLTDVIGLVERSDIADAAVGNDQLDDDIKIGSLSNDSPAPAFWSTSVMNVLNWLLLYTNTGLQEKIGDVNISSSDGSLQVVKDETDPNAPAFDITVNPAAGPAPVDMDIIVRELYGAPFVVTANASKCVRDGSMIHVMLDVTFTFPDGDNLGQVSGLPYERIGPEFAVSGIVETPTETAPGSGYYVTHQVIVRPDQEDGSAVRLFWPDGIFYHPSEMYEGDYRLVAELFYLTDGTLIDIVYVQDFESADIYIADFDSIDIYTVDYE